MTDDEICEYLGQTFEWDRVKAARNAVSHGVRFTEAATVLFDQQADYFTDEEHSFGEERYTVIGQSERLKSLLVVHVWRGERIRLISARRATPGERRRYEAEFG